MASDGNGGEERQTLLHLSLCNCFFLLHRIDCALLAATHCLVHLLVEWLAFACFDWVPVNLHTPVITAGLRNNPQTAAAREQVRMWAQWGTRLCSKRAAITIAVGMVRGPHLLDPAAAAAAAATGPSSAGSPPHPPPMQQLGMELREGSCFAEVTRGALDQARYVSLVSEPAAGAIATFLGVTRDNFQGKATQRLEYEAYVPMAARKLLVGRGCWRAEAACTCSGAAWFGGTPAGWPAQRSTQACSAWETVAAALPALQELCQQACGKWQLCRMAVAHRTGTVLVGEASVIIAVSSAHRREALEVGSRRWRLLPLAVSSSEPARRMPICR